MGHASATVAAPETKSAAVIQPRLLAVNFLFLSCGEFTAKLLTFASFSYLARVLGPWYYGMLEFTLALMVFFTLPVDLGLGAYGAREIARKPQHAARLLHEITGLRLLLALCSMLALAVFIAVIQKSVELKLLLALYGVSLLGGPVLLQWFFQAHDRMHWVAIASIVRQAVFAGLVFLLCRNGSDVVRIGIVECASVAAVGACCVYITRKKMHVTWTWPEVHFRRLLGHINAALPLGLTELAWAFMWYFCTVMLGFIFSDVSLGWFGASHRALMALHTFVWLYFFNMLPSISRCVGLPHEHLLELMDRSVRFAAWMGIFAAGLLTVVSPLALTIMYGPSFHDAWHSFSVLVWMLPVAMLSGHHRYILVAYNHQKRLLYCTAASALAAVALSFVLVPLYKSQGAAYALLIANIFNLALVYVSVRKLVVRVSVGRHLVAPISALAVAAVLYLALTGWNFWVALVAGVAMYALGLIRADGKRLVAFALTVIRRPDVKAEAA